MSTSVCEPVVGSADTVLDWAGDDEGGEDTPLEPRDGVVVLGGMELEVTEFVSEGVLNTSSVNDTARTPFAPEAAAVIDAIRDTLEGLDRDEVAKRRQVGQMLVDLTDDPAGQYGRPDFDRVRDALPFQKDVLRQCLDLARKFSDHEFDTLSALRGPTGAKLKWSHFIAIARLPTYDAARTAAVQALDTGATGKAIAHAQVAAAGPQSAGGRKPKMPANTTDMVAGVSRACTTLSNLVNQSWFSDESPDYASQVADANLFQRKRYAEVIQGSIDKMEVAENDLALAKSELERLLVMAEARAEV